MLRVLCRRLVSSLPRGPIRLHDEIEIVTSDGISPSQVFLVYQKFKSDMSNKQAIRLFNKLTSLPLDHGGVKKRMKLVSPLLRDLHHRLDDTVPPKDLRNLHFACQNIGIAGTPLLAAIEDRMERGSILASSFSAKLRTSKISTLNDLLCFLDACSDSQNLDKTHLIQVLNKWNLINQNIQVNETK